VNLIQSIFTLPNILSIQIPKFDMEGAETWNVWKG